LIEAEQSYLRAIELQPNFADAISNLGNVYLAQGRVNDAMAYYKKALVFDPHYAQAHSNIGKAYLELDQLDDAEQSLRQAIAIKPDLGIAYSNLGKVLLLQGKIDQAYLAYQYCEPGTTSKSILVKYAFQLPAVMGTKAEVLLSRTRLEQCIERLGDTALLDDPIKQGCASNFYLAFHGENDKPIQEKIARFYTKACPSLLYVAPHCDVKRSTPRRIKIGFISQFIYTHSVSLSFGHIVKAINQIAAFEVTLISAHDHGGAQVEAAYADFKGKHLRLSQTLDVACNQIAALELDVLVYLDIGMEPLGYFLAYARLAPVQCVLGGHPVTTGIANIDYYLSSDLAEPVDADSHYSEKLIRLPFGAFYFERPTPRKSGRHAHNWACLRDVASMSAP
jgi:protein O-GlcNAc transferase